jgi:hypothetical protein
LYWRQKIDCFRNSTSAVTRSRFGHKATNGVSTNEQVQALLKIGVDMVRDVPGKFVYGTFLKRKEIELQVPHPEQPGTTVNVRRTRIVSGAFDFVGDVDMLTNFVMAKHWPDNCPWTHDPPREHQEALQVSWGDSRRS